MNSIVLVVLIGVFALTSAANLPQQFAEEETSSEVFSNDDVTNKIGIQGRTIEGRSLTSRGERKLREFVARMPEGFPELELPVLSPFVQEHYLFKLKKSFYDITSNIEDFRIEGLDDVVFNYFDISYVWSQHVRYNVTFPNIVISGKYISETALDLVKQYAVKVQHFGEGEFEFTLENLTFEGYFKYTMPFAFGSISIYNFNGTVALENVVSNIGGLAGESDYTELINEKIEEYTKEFVMENQDEINDAVREFLIPQANRKLHGKTVWSLIF